MYKRFKLFFSLLGLLLLIYLLLRIVFFFLYFRFGDAGLNNIIKIFYWGFRLDLFSVFLINFPVWVYLLFVGDFIANKSLKKKILLFLLLFLNIPFIVLNVIDLGYFSFNLRRSTIDLFKILNDSRQAWGIFFVRYWYLVLFGLFLASLLVFYSRKILRGYAEAEFPAQAQKSVGAAWALPAAILLLFFLLSRGFGNRPVAPPTVLLHLAPAYQPLAENSTITFLYSLYRSQTRLELKNYYPPLAVDSLFNIRRQYARPGGFQKRNVIIFVLESFSRNLIDKNSPQKAQTPFLDSLMQKSIVCDNVFANGLESNKGLVALLAGIPPFLDEAYYNSSYSNNSFRGLGTLLKEQGYRTSFFLGARPDHFGFGKLCKLVGIENYYSEKEYANPKDHDGNWGIFDHKFLPFAAEKLKEKSRPFLAVVFNISSHHPYKLPPGLRQAFTIPGQNAQQNGITYTDYSIRLFFDRIKNTDWYKNSIFLFVADHAITLDVKPKSVLYTAYQIPFFIHQPFSRQPWHIGKTVQQLDLVPSVLDLLNYQKPFMSFGKSMFDSSGGFAVNKIYGNYQLINDRFLFGYNEKNEQPSYFFEYRKDKLLEHNLAGMDTISLEQLEAERKLKAFIQTFNNGLVRHQLLIK